MKDKQTKDVFGCLGMLILMPFAGLLRGFIFTQLWAWFLVPLFHLPPIGILEAIGLSYVATFFASLPAKSETDWSYTYLAIFLPALLTWGFGFIVHLLMH